MTDFEKKVLSSLAYIGLVITGSAYTASSLIVVNAPWLMVLLAGLLGFGLIIVGLLGLFVNSSN